MTKIKNYTIIISIAVTVIFLLWLNIYAIDSWNYYSSYFGIVIVVAVPLLAFLFVKLYKKYEMCITEKSFKILFAISAFLFLLIIWDDFGTWFFSRALPSHLFSAEIGVILAEIGFILIIIMAIIAVFTLAKPFAKLYKKRVGNINESILFIICTIPFLWGVIDWITNRGYYTIFRCYEHDPNTYGVSPIGWSIVGNFNFTRGMVITYIAIIVVAALKKGNIKCNEFLPKFFVLVGIYNGVCNLEYILQHIDFANFDDFNFVMDMLGSFVPLLLALVCVMITLLSSFLHGYFSKTISNSDVTHLS